MRRAMESVVGCLDNVFLASHPVAVTWSEFPVLQAEIGDALRWSLEA